MGTARELGVNSVTSGATSVVAEVAVYLVESSKGMVSIQHLPVKADRILVVVLGQFRFAEDSIDDQAEILYCTDFRGAALNSIANKILVFCQSSRIKLVFTDDTFNESSFVIQKKISSKNPKLILIDHYRDSGLTYKDQYCIRALVRFRHPLARHWREFRPIKFSNGAIGYRLALNFDQIEYYRGHTEKIKKKSIDAEVVILIPLHHSPYYSAYLGLIDALLQRVANEVKHGWQKAPRLAHKMHPRCSQPDVQALAPYQNIARTTQLASPTPLEFYDLSDKIVVNLDSSIGNPCGARILLMARYFGHTAEEASNMSGEPCEDTMKLEQVLGLVSGSTTS